MRYRIFQLCIPASIFLWFTYIIFKKLQNVSEYNSVAVDVPELITTNYSVRIPVLVLSCNRISISRCLDQLLKYRPSKEHFPITVSLGCSDAATRNRLEEYIGDVFFVEQDHNDDVLSTSYERIAKHYRQALTTMFSVPWYDAVIIVEDDLDISPDFFEYFRVMYRLLKEDSTLYCISAWNDNGKLSLIDTNQLELLYRTDFFPGLGWMLLRSFWNEISSKWPDTYWDDWLRHPKQRKNRACIRPEISRTKVFEKWGASQGYLYDKHIRLVKLNEKFVNFSNLDTFYLRKDNYDEFFLKMVADSPVVSYKKLKARSFHQYQSVRVIYKTKLDFQRIAKTFGLMDDIRNGIPRTAYKGVVSFKHKSTRIFVSPENISKYNNFSLEDDG